MTGINADGSSESYVHPNNGTAGSAVYQCVLSVNSDNVTIDNGILRNAKGGLGNDSTGTPYPNGVLELLGGDNLQLHDMKIGNYNDDCGSLTYANASTVPNYDVENSGVDDSYSGDMELVGASITELEDTASPGVNYYNIHA